MEFKRRKPAELFAQYRNILRQLQAQGIIRTDNPPSAGWAEYLTLRVYDGTLPPPSQKGWDVQARDKRRLQVKSRVLSDPPKSGQRQLSAISNFDFDVLVVVLLSDVDYSVVRAVELPMPAAKRIAKPLKKGYRIMATDDNLAAGIDMTERFRVVARSLN